MEIGWHFGYNCRHYLPTLHKCRIFIDMYSERTDLLRDKWLTTQELLIYTGAPHEELLRRLNRGEITTKRQKVDGSLRFRVRAPWDWDDCPLKDSGGQCLHYEPHDGRRISCLMDLESPGWVHPNLEDVPSVDETATFETALASLQIPGSRA